MDRLKRILLALVVVVTVAVPIGAWTQRQNISDWLILRNYTPSDRIAKLANDTTMTEYSRKLFYVHRPQLNDRSNFRSNCTIAEQSIVLGCYVSQEGIYIFDVEDKRLDGVLEVTAAHEVLHAAYDRLSSSERQRIDRLADDVLKGLTDERIKKTIESYRERDATVVSNELHSILATEADELPAELEDYYKQYFNDRKVVVAFSNHYEAAFEERKAKIAGHDAQLADLKIKIDELQADLNARSESLEADRVRLDGLLASQQISEYNAGVGSYNQAVRAYNADASRLESLIDQFNTIVAERNAVALEENELIKAIDSNSKQIETQ